MTTTIRRVLVHGANGVQGGAIARQLRLEGFEVRGSVRDPSKSGALTAAGIEVVAADLESRLALQHASRGVDAVVLTLPLDWSRERVLRWTDNAVAAAGDGGAAMVVMNSSTRVPAEITDVPSFELRREAEAMVRELGPPSIVLRPPFFLENLASPFIAGAMVNERMIAYPVPERLRINWLSVVDLGAYVAAALRRPDLAGRTFDVAGPEALDGWGLARSLSSALGDPPLRYAAVPPDAFEQALAQRFGPAVAHGIARSYFWIAANADTALFSLDGGDLQRALARPAMSVATWARAQTWPAPAAMTA
jgi:NAD(P)H dehydrogenase (quinone)